MKFITATIVTLFCSAVAVQAVPVSSGSSILVTRESADNIFAQINEIKAIMTKKSELPEGDAELIELDKRGSDSLSNLIYAVYNSGMLGEIWKTFQTDADLKNAVFAVGSDLVSAVFNIVLSWITGGTPGGSKSTVASAAAYATASAKATTSSSGGGLLGFIGGLYGGGKSASAAASTAGSVAGSVATAAASATATATAKATTSSSGGGLLGFIGGLFGGGKSASAAASTAVSAASVAGSVAGSVATAAVSAASGVIANTGTTPIAVATPTGGDSNAVYASLAAKYGQKKRLDEGDVLSKRDAVSLITTVVDFLKSSGVLSQLLNWFVNNGETILTNALGIDSSATQNVSSAVASATGSGSGSSNNLLNQLLAGTVGAATATGAGVAAATNVAVSNVPALTAAVINTPIVSSVALPTTNNDAILNSLAAAYGGGTTLVRRMI